MMAAKTRRVNNTLLETIGAELMIADSAQNLLDKNLRVEYIPAELIRPDPVQPRRVLPEQIHFAFHAEQLTPVQALRELIQSAQLAARQNGRPFSSVIDLLPDEAEDAEPNELIRLSPEEQLMHELVNLALTIRNDGQVNPLTIIDSTQGVTRLYRIETGERRYWATWLAREFLTGYEGDGAIPCIIVPRERASAFRQAKENTARAGLSAVAMARQAALLIMTVHNVERPDDAVSNDFYRQALELDLRDKREFTADVLSAMGGISKVHLSHYKALLRLSDEAMELADRHQIEEKRLRYVLDLPSEAHMEMVRQIIAFNLTSLQVKQLCQQETDDENAGDDIDPISRPALQMARAIRGETGVLARDLARALLKQENNVEIARVRILAMRQMLDQAEQYLAG